MEKNHDEVSRLNSRGNDLSGTEVLLTTIELSRKLKVSDRTVQNLVYEGKIRKIQIGRCVRFLFSQVIEDLGVEK